MLEKVIKYTDFKGEEREETFYFHLTKADIMEMQLEVKGGLSTVLERITQTKDVPELIKIFKDLIKRSYGEMSPDGRKFIKNDQVWEDFKSTNAYSVLFMELAQDAKAASDFIRNVVPADLAEEVKKAEAKKISTKN